MSIRVATCEIQFSRFRIAGSVAGESATYGVGNIVSSLQDPGPAQSDARVLAPAASGGPDVQSVDPQACIPIPADLPADRALLVPRLARVLSVWECAGLELGESAIITSGSVDAGLFCLVSSWRTGRSPVYLELGGATGLVAGTATVIPAEDPQFAIEALTRLLRTAPGAASVVLSPSATAVDLLLEVLPAWGRILLATPAMEPAAVDFYNHVHRKGARLLGVPSTPMCVFDPVMRQATEPQVRRAIRILQHEILAESCLRQAA